MIMSDAIRNLNFEPEVDSILEGMKTLKDVSDGARTKLWVENGKGEKFLYKRDKKHSNGAYTYESLSEFLAMKLGHQLDISVVDIILGGHSVLSKVMWDVPLQSFIELSEEMSHSFHMSNLTTFNVRTLLRCETNPYYKETIIMLLFDALIGNSDRHPGNFMYNSERGFYPLFDNGSSLLCYIEDRDIKGLMSDSMRFTAACETKSKPVLRDNQRITHKQLVQILREEYPEICESFCEKVQALDLEELFIGVNVSEERKQLIIKFLIYRMNWFRRLSNE